MLLGSGIAKISEVEAELHRQNFRHLVAIEYEKEGDDDVRDDMRTNVAFAWKYGFSGACIWSEECLSEKRSGVCLL